MAKKFKLNGKEVTAREFDYNLICDMEEVGFSLDDFEEKPFQSLRGYVALCKKCTVEKAGKEISEHVENGGDLEDIMKVMGEQIENSGFFRGQQTDKTEKDTEN